jgi:cyclopropane fatty-acyl-phospholipid synthase-like methyltransferase
MTTAFKLIAKTLSGQVPPRVLVWGLLNTLNRSFGTGNRRFEFERLYLESPDPWNYHSSSYERRKYERVLACALKWRSAGESVLEVGCSLGVFSRMLTHHFDKVTAIDVSKEALSAATRYNSTAKNVRFMHSDLQSLDTDGQYDVIVCAEVLYYVAEMDVEVVCRQLGRYLSARGIILLVTGVSGGEQPDSLYFDGWADVFAARFGQTFKEIVQDPARPYLIAVFSRRA